MSQTNRAWESAMSKTDVEVDLCTHCDHNRADKMGNITDSEFLGL